MTKSIHKSVIVAAIAFILCALAAVFCFVFSPRPVAKAEETDPAPTDEVIVFDKLEDFRTKDNGDGTYTILGGDPSGESDPMLGKLMVENGLSVQAYCKLLGEEYNAENTYVDADLIKRIWNGDATGKQFKIVIPATVSKIENFAFGLRERNFFVSGFRKIISEDYPELAVIPELVGFEFAKIDGKRAITKDGFGTSILGQCSVQKLVVPKEFEEWDAAQSEFGEFGSPFFGINIPEIDFATEQLTKIPEYAFNTWCDNADESVLFNLTIPEGIEQIGTGAFFGAYNLTEVALPSSLTFIGDSVFADTQLQKIDVKSIADYVRIEKGSSVFSSELPYLLYIDGVAQTELIITGIESIPAGTFNGYACTRVEIKSDVKNIGVGAFRNCDSLEIVILPDGITTENHAFADCPSLNEITIPREASFASYTFEHDNIQKVYSASWVDWCSCSFGNHTANPLSNGGDLYIGGEAKTEIVIPVGVERIPSYAFVSKKFTSVDIQSPLKEIGAGAFYGCSNLTEITLTDGLESIGDNAFNSSGITSIDIPNSVTSVGLSAFIGCKSLKSVKLSNSMTEIQSGTFDGCTALESITLPSSITTLSSGVFEGCSSLKSIDLSNIKTIGGASFKNCSNLSSVILGVFKSYDIGGSQYEHFLNCTSLTSVTLPEGITSISANMFSGCTNLQTVYLPSTLDPAKIAANAFNNCHADLKVISPDRASYAKYAEKLSGEYLTYPVQLRYVYKGITVATQTAYYGSAYDQVLPDISEVWYSDEGCTTEVTDMTALLAAAEGDEITLYAKALTTKMFLPRAEFTYTGQEYTGEALNALLREESDKIEAGMSTRVIEYTDANGESASDLPRSVCDAGTYTVRISGGTMGEAYADIELRVVKKQIDLADYENNLGFKLIEIGGTAVDAELLDGTLYIYAYGEGKRFASLRPIDTSSDKYKGYVLYSIRDVKHSVVRYRGESNALKLGIVGSMAGVAYSVEYVGGNTANGLGMYFASATLTPDKNYELVLRNATELNARGLTFTPEADGSYTVRKEWYVVDIGNWLVGDTETGTDYELPASWTFGATPEFGIPYAVYGDVEAAQYGNSTDPVSMELYLGNTKIGNTFHRNNMTEYLNKATPAGEYRLTVTLRNVITEDGVEHSGYIYAYRFVVTRAALPANELAAVHAALKDGKFFFEVTDNGMFDQAAEAAVEAMLALNVSADRAGTIWAAEAYNVYYGSFEIAYNLARWQSDEYKSAVYVEANEADTYTVYYRISALNYYSSIENLTGNETRYNYSYSLVKYAVFDTPTVIDDGLVYTGSVVKPEIEESEYYEIVWSKTDEYVNGGEHKVTFKLYDNEHYRWKTPDSEDKSCVTVTYSVAKGENTWTTSPEVLGWDYNSFDKEINRIYGIAKFTSTNNGVWFKVTTDNEGKNAVKGLEKFEVGKNGVVENEEIIKLLNGLFVGNYFLTATVGETNNFKGIETTLNLKVDLAANGWSDAEDAIKLPSWIVGKYSAKENPISVKPKYGSSVIVIKDMDGNEYYNSETGVNKLNDAPIGKYLLSASVKATNNYAGLAERTFTIEVFAEPGLAWWVTLIIVIAVVAVIALTLFILWKKGIIQLLTDKIAIAIRTRATVDATIASVRAAKKMEEGRKSVAAAKRKDAAEARKAKAEEEKNKPVEEKAAALEEKAKQASERAERMRARAEAMQARAERMREQAKEPPKEEENKEEPQSEAAATEEENN